MNAQDAERVLKLRSSLTSQPYGPTVIAAWAEALNDVTEHDAKRAMQALAHNGEKELTVPAIRTQLRLERRNAQVAVESQPTLGTPLKFAVMDPDAVEARRAWHTAGMHGHYPACPCDPCKTRIRTDNNH